MTAQLLTVVSKSIFSYCGNGSESGSESEERYFGLLKDREREEEEEEERI